MLRVGAATFDPGTVPNWADERLKALLGLGLLGAESELEE